MSDRWTAKVWCLPGTVKSGQRIVLLALANHTDHEGLCWPGDRHIADMCALSRRNVRRIIRKLESAGYIETRPRPGRTLSWVIGKSSGSQPAERRPTT